MAVSKQGDDALMFSLARVCVKPLVERRRGGQDVQQEDKAGQHRGDDRLAGWFELTPYEPHNKCKLTDIMTGASDLLALEGRSPTRLD